MPELDTLRPMTQEEIEDLERYDRAVQMGRTRGQPPEVEKLTVTPLADTPRMTELVTPLPGRASDKVVQYRKERAAQQIGQFLPHGA